jgi:hypothetical protein
MLWGKDAFVSTPVHPGNSCSIVLIRMASGLKRANFSPNRYDNHGLVDEIAWPFLVESVRFLQNFFLAKSVILVFSRGVRDVVRPIPPDNAHGLPAVRSPNGCGLFLFRAWH